MIPTTKAHLVAFALALLLPGPANAAAGTASWEGIRAIKERPTVPDVAFKDRLGRDRGFIEFRGDVVVAVFWATWCPICAREMPKFDRLEADLAGQGVRVVALSVDREGIPVVERYYADRGLRHLKIYHDSESILASVIGIRGVPTAFVIDPKGRMVGVVEGGAEWDSPEAYAYLRALR